MTTAQPTDVPTTVKALLDAAQITMSDEEFDLFVRIYPAMRAGADSLYIPETRYEDPALIFDAAWDLGKAALPADDPHQDFFKALDCIVESKLEDSLPLFDSAIARQDDREPRHCAHRKCFQGRLPGDREATTWPLVRHKRVTNGTVVPLSVLVRPIPANIAKLPELLMSTKSPGQRGGRAAPDEAAFLL